MPAHPDLALLHAALRELLPQARLREQVLSRCAGLRLLLLDDTLRDVRLDGDVVARIMDDPLYWVFCWASGEVLAAHVTAYPELVAGKRVLDFGCGSGVVGIAAARAGAREVIACDRDPLALTATRHNAQLNGVGLTEAGDFQQVEGAIDLILVADVLYDRANLAWLERFQQRAARVLLADSRIRDFDHPPYRRIGVVESSTIPDLDESPEFRRVTLYEATGR